MRIVFDTIKGMMIPEGNVTEIKDASGNVLWSASKGWFFNVGTLTTTKVVPTAPMPAMVQKDFLFADYPELPFEDITLLNTLVVNGEVYKLTYTKSTYESGGYTYPQHVFWIEGSSTVSEEYPYNIRFTEVISQESHYKVYFNSHVAGTYDVSIGITEQ